MVGQPIPAFPVWNVQATVLNKIEAARALI
jgi:hypothetical protein